MPGYVQLSTEDFERLLSLLEESGNRLSRDSDLGLCQRIEEGLQKVKHRMSSDEGAGEDTIISEISGILGFIGGGDLDEER